jgi:uncharacterized protein (DUF1015 family)
VAILEPVRAILYPEGVDPALVTSPPYDVISPAERQRLAGLHPDNIVRVILPEDAPEDDATNTRPRRAAALLRQWLAEGTLVHDGAPRYYAYRMDYTIAGEARSTSGAIGAVTLEPLGEGAIFGHEKTMPTPRGDRRDLMLAARANLEPIWLVGGAGLIGPVVAEASAGPARVDVTDPDGVRHRLWPLSEAGGERLAAGLAGPLVIADGHHRYGASLELRDRLREHEGSGPWDATLALVSDPTLDPPALLPIHRLTNLAVEHVAARVQLSAFEGDPAALIRHVAAQGPGTVGLAGPGGCWTMAATPEEGDPDTAWLAAQVLEPLGAQTTYVHDEAELAEGVAGGATGFIMAPLPIPMVIQTALAGRVMPPKSTLFWPKPRTGMLLRDLDL